MEDVDLRHAKEHLEELIERARRGKDVRIADAKGGAVRVTPFRDAGPDLTATRVTDTMPPFVPLKEPRKPGRLEGTIPPPPVGFFDPLSDEELKDWYGDDP
jgi:antitoxin (DNA-binding transcriptional repressor) of toxin-antitoxin stability system